jgi:hypothetical protein
LLSLRASEINPQVALPNHGKWIVVKINIKRGIRRSILKLRR